MYTTANQTFGGVRIQQTWTALFVLEKILREYSPGMIIELGTGYGALTGFFSMFAPTYSFDNLNRVTKKWPRVKYHICDIFDEIQQYKIEQLIKTTGVKVFMFCDNGNKPREFAAFSPLLKPGDMIFVHDYGLEIKDTDIDSVVKKLDLKPIEQKLCDELKTLLRGFIR